MGENITAYRQEMNKAIEAHKRIFVTSHEAEKQYVWLSGLVPLFVGVLIWMNTAGLVAFNVNEKRYLKYAMSVAVNVWLSSVAVMMIQFPAKCKQNAPYKSSKEKTWIAWFCSKILWFFYYDSSDDTTFMVWIFLFIIFAKWFGLPLLYKFVNADFKGIYDMFGGPFYTLIGALVTFDEATMTEAFYWHIPHLYMVGLIMIFTQIPYVKCVLIYLEATIELVIGCIRGCVIYFGLISFVFLLDDWFNQKNWQNGLYGYVTRSTLFRPVAAVVAPRGIAAAGGPYTPTPYNIKHMVTVELAEKKPHALTWSDPASGKPRRQMNHNNVFDHYKKNCTIGGAEPDELLHIKPVIVAANIAYDFHAKREYCKKELERLGLM